MQNNTTKNLKELEIILIIELDYNYFRSTKNDNYNTYNNNKIII